MMDDTISRQAAMDFVGSMEMCDEISVEAYQKLMNYLEELPSAQPEQAAKGCRNCKYGKYNDHWKTHFCYNPNECTEWNLWEPSAQPEIIHCGECIYYDPPHVEKEDARYEYSEMPKEAFDVLGTGLVSMEYGINIGGRCCVDYYCKSYSDDKRVYVREDNYCGRAERRTDE